MQLPDVRPVSGKGEFRQFIAYQYHKLADRAKQECGITVRPFDLAEFTRIATEMKPIFDPNAAIPAEKDGRPIACAVAVPDVNQALRGTWVLEDNDPINRTVERIGAVRYQTYRIYQKAIG